MAKYLYRSCPRCDDGYVGIIVLELEQNLPAHTVNGHCMGCGYRFAWIMIRGGRRPGLDGTKHSSARLRQLVT
jgi:hypothetical protein